MATRVLNVAEKNDAAKGISDILSRGRYRMGRASAKYNKVYVFDHAVFGQNAQMTMTSVSGHLFNYDFVGQYRGNWEAFSPVELFQAPIEKRLGDNTEGPKIVQQLEREAQDSQYLIIWTDCDREGENIGYEVIDVCLRRNRYLKVYRARFSEITYRSINNALQNLIEPDKRVSDAVDCRQELDLRIGAAFTRFQTLRLRRTIPQLRDLIISYGSCQFPTLGFVVERYKSRENFIREPFWKLAMKHTKGGEKKDPFTTEFAWRRLRIFDQDICDAYLQKCLERQEATVERVSTKPKSRWRPLALDTVELEKLASRRLRMTAKRTMETAERLYTQGFISYPRTETNIFPRELDLRPLVELFTTDHQYGDFAQSILQNGPNPRNGTKSDQAHPPIHPIKYATPLELQGDAKAVYEFIVRRFLACLSRDAKGLETIVDADVNGEKFYANGLIITDRGYLEIYHPYDQWSDKGIASYEEGETFEPDSLTMQEGSTSAPGLLTEADLIALMEKHGIGTDATHAEHIEKIKSRCYAALTPEQRFIPGYLGLGLVDGYDSMGHPMSKPRLRAELETALKEICDGRRTREEVLRVQLEKYKTIFERATEEAVKLDQAIAGYFANGGGGNGLGGGGPGGGGDIPRRNGGLPPGGGGGGNDENNDDDDDDGGDHGRRPPGRGGGGGRPPPSAPASLPAPSIDDGNDESTPTCSCGQPGRLLTCKKEGPNRGRQFYRCPGDQCKFFQWMDGGGGASTAARPEWSQPSNRAAPPAAATNGSGQQNRWTAANSNDGDQRNANDAIPSCQCGVEARLLTVKKDGPNQGRQFFACSQKNVSGGCNFFQWVEGVIEVPSTSTSQGNGYNSRSTYDNRNRGGGNGRNFKKSSSGPAASRMGGAAYAEMFPQAVSAGGGGGNRGGKRGRGGGLYGSNENANSGEKKPRKRTNFGRNASGAGKKCGFCQEGGHTVRTCPKKHGG